MTGTELQQAIQNHSEWLNSAQSAGKQFAAAGAGFSEGAPFARARLDRAIFRGSVLRSAQFSRAGLRAADFSDCQLAGAIFSGAKLDETLFRNADLRGADFGGAKRLLPMQLAGADLRRAHFDESVDFNKPLEIAGQWAQSSLRSLLVALTVTVYSVIVAFGAADASLLTPSATAKLPLIDAAVPLGAFYLIGPLLLTALQLYVNISLLRTWEQAALLPAFLPDGRSIESAIQPSLLNGLLFRYIKRLRPASPFLGQVQALITRALVYWSFPAVILLLCGRYVVRHDLVTTGLQTVMLSFSTAAGFLFLDATRACFSSARVHLYRRSLAAGLTMFLLCAGVALGAVGLSGDSGVMVSSDNPVDTPLAARVAQWTPKVILKAGTTVATAFRLYLNLEGADFTAPPGQKLRLRHVDLAFANAPHVKFPAADLQYGVFNSANLEDAIFTGADLRYASLLSTDISGADFGKADLRHVRLRPKSFNTVLNLPNANDRDFDKLGPHFEHADLSDCDLKNAEFQYAKFDGATLEETHLEGANLGFASFRRAILRDTHLKGAKLQGANFQEAQISEPVVLEPHPASNDADAFKASKPHPSPSGADFNRETFARANNWMLAHFWDDSLLALMGLPADQNQRVETRDFRNYDFQSSFLDEADFHGYRLDGANLGNTDLQRADFTGATFTGADIRCADLTNAKGLDRNNVRLFKNWELAYYSDLQEVTLGLPKGHDKLRKTACENGRK
ncbi:MAG: hypothetical protein C5B51_08325 [Terriglobia bacterium]|nr:MAG: hypothetical protein C5B51_08325 [Terriglobia bacterium]